MNILSIGNSFSQDAQHWLHQVAQAEGEALNCVNLYIGGCNLQTHWENYVNQTKDYLYEVNGNCASPLCRVSIQEALAKETWDVISLQQASHDSGKSETYEPYLTQLASALREAMPKARLIIHETWAYDGNSDHPSFPDYGCEQEEMYRRLHCCYKEAAQHIGADIIPCGTVIQSLRHTETFDAGHGISLCRDGFHMSETLGRYALAVTWFAVLTQRMPEKDFIPTDSAADDAPRRALIRSVVAKVMETEGAK